MTKINQRKFDEWMGLGGPRPSNDELADYLDDYVGNLEDRIDGTDAAVIHEAAAVLRDPRTAAAPDMLSALEEMVTLNNRCTTDQLKAWMHRARAAIKRVS